MSEKLTSGKEIVSATVPKSAVSVPWVESAASGRETGSGLEREKNKIKIKR